MFGTQNVPVNKNRYKLQLFFYLFCFRSYLIDYDRWMLNFFFVSKFFCCFVSILFFFWSLAINLRCVTARKGRLEAQAIYIQEIRENKTRNGGRHVKKYRSWGGGEADI